MHIGLFGVNLILVWLRRLHVCVSTTFKMELQLNAAHCNTLQHTATHCNTLQHSCNTAATQLQRLQRYFVCCTHIHKNEHVLHEHVLQCVAVCVAVCCRTMLYVVHTVRIYEHALQCVAVCCNVFQYVAVCCSVLQ